MSHIPEHTGNHIHFSDDQETGGKNSQIIDQNHFESQIQESTMHEDSKIQKEEIVKGPLSEDDNLNMRTAQGNSHKFLTICTLCHLCNM